MRLHAATLLKASPVVTAWYDTGKEAVRAPRVRSPLPMNNTRTPITAAVLALLDADEMFDHAPGGDPPITTGQYRRITRAIACLSATATPGEYLDVSPTRAFQAGQATVLNAIQRVLSQTLPLPGHPTE